MEGFNPLCGDRLTLRLKFSAGNIADIKFEGQGCAISTASASLMTEAVKGRTRTEALELFDRVHRLLTDDAAPAGELGKLAALSGVRGISGARQMRQPLLAHARLGLEITRAAFPARGIHGMSR